MAEEKIDALIPQSPNALEKTSDGARGILSTMVSDALVLARNNSLTAPRFRIGNHDLREPDYRQILLWAKALELDPEEVIRRLEDCTLETWRYQDDQRLDVKLTSRIENGSIVALAWDFDLLPLTLFEWVDGLVILEAGFVGSPTPSRLSLRLPLLTFLLCDELELVELNLTNVPELIGLNVNRNQLAKLDLSHVPKLIWLNCYDNKLTELDLFSVPGLTYLSCGSNKLTKLDLSSVPGLTKLMCHTNLLTWLDLSDVPGLTFLACGKNKLTELDLSNVPRITEIWCSDNQLTEFDPSKVPELTKLYVEGNKIMKLDISHLKYLIKFCCDLFVLVATSPTQKLARDNGRKYRKFLLGSD
jgi:hypothetical protein